MRQVATDWRGIRSPGRGLNPVHSTQIELWNRSPLRHPARSRRLEEGGQALLCDAWLRFEREEGR